MSSEEWNVERFTLESVKIQATWAALPAEEKSFGKVLELVAHFPTSYQTAALALLQCGYDARVVAMHKQKLDHAETVVRHGMESDQAIRDWKRESRAFWVGLLLLFGALIFSALLREINPSTALILRATAGVGVCLLIAFLPGLFSLDSTINVHTSKVVLRATGGLAGLVMVYLFDPGWISSVLQLHK